VNEWGPVRHVLAPQKCVACWRTIPKASPGVRTGERGTKAWFLKLSGMGGAWMCCRCRDEESRADGEAKRERAAIVANVRPMRDVGERFDVLVDTDLRVVKGGRELWEAIRGGTCEALTILAVPAEVGREMERAR